MYHRPIARQRSLFGDGPEDQQTPVVLSYGMGVDSTALLLRWVRDKRSRDFPLDALTVLTAHTGDEFQDTQRLVETHVLPLLREYRIRYVQVARAGFYQAEGITVLDDSREPTRCFTEGDFKLSQELTMNGIVPQVASKQRRCTAHAKGFPLSSWTDQEFGDRQIVKAIGYNADEQFRADRSEGYATDSRPIRYPLVEWGWGRDRCEKYVRRITGETWRKSLCTMCCFSGAKPDVMQRYRESPAEAAHALYVEFVSLCMNPRAPLFGKKSLRDAIEADGNAEALRLLEERLDAERWAVYRVRRIYYAKGRADRKTERLAEGSRAEAAADMARRGGVQDGHTLRLQVRPRGEGYPSLEETLVAAPAVVVEKSRGRFEEAWGELSGPSLFE